MIQMVRLVIMVVVGNGVDVMIKMVMLVIMVMVVML